MHSNVTEAEATRTGVSSVVQADMASSDSSIAQEDGSSQLISWVKPAGSQDEIKPPSGDFRRVTHGW